MKCKFMKKVISLFVAVLAVFCLTQKGIAQPVANIEAPVYQFDPVPDGVRVDHEFVIKNDGDSELHIENVLPP